MDKDIRVGARVTPEEKLRLASLARAARRTEADVLRLLINNADPESLRQRSVRFEGVRA